MPKILIAYDGSDCSDKALRDLKNAGLPEKAEAVILTVADLWKNIPVEPVMDQKMVFLTNELELIKASLEEARDIARTATEKIKKYFPNWNVRPESVSDSPAWGLIDKIESWKPDLVVMGSHGRSAAGRILFGSVSHKILSHVHCNLRISRARAESEESVAPLRVIIAFDGSEGSEIAFETALRRHWPKGTAIKVITVIDMRISTAFIYPSAPIRYWMMESDREPVAWVERMLADQKRRIEEKGFIAFTEMLKGDPKRILLKEAERWGADSIFVGPRGLSAREKMLVGSVSTALALHAHCAVEVVHRLWDGTACCENAREETRDSMAKFKHD